jgi:branched-chain amino acid transport system substrate-binding protein
VPLLGLLLLNACVTLQDSAQTPRVKPATKNAKNVQLPATASSLKVGLLLPLSGARADVGQALQNAAQLAVFDDNGAAIELLPRDTGDTPQQALDAFKQLADSGVKLVVGPLFAPQVAAVKAEALRRDVAVLALSNDTKVAGSGIYVLGFAPQDQVSRVTSFACAQNSRRFAGLLPDSAYGELVAQSLRQAVQRCGGANLSLKRYAAGTTQIGRQLEELATQRQMIDTLFLAEAPAALRNTAIPSALDGRHVRLLGTALWAEDGAGRAVPALIGGWYAAPEGGDRARFQRSYQQAYAAPAPTIAGLAYDAVALAAALQKRGIKPDAAALTSSSGFMGVDGAFRLRADGTAERAFAVNRVALGGRDILDPAPTSFAPVPTH